MIRIVRLFALVAMAALVALAIGVPTALAAPATQWESVAMNLSTDANAPLLMVSGRLSDSTPLPATVALAVPAGAQVQWVGEVLGGDPSADPEATPTNTTSGGYDIYTFTMTKGRIAQIEAIVPPAVTTSDGVYNVDFSQTAFADAAKYAVAIQIPQAAQLSETPTGTAGLAPGPTGFRYYQQSFSKVKTGDPINVAFSYTLPAGAAAGTAAPTAAGGGGGMLVPILLVGVALLVGAALVVGVRRKMNPIVEEPAVRSAAAKTRKPTTTVAADDDGGFSTQDESAKKPARKATARIEAEGEDDTVPAAPRTKVAQYGTLAIIVALIVGGIFAVSNGSRAQRTGDAITKVLSSGEACTQAQIPLALPEGADPEQAAEQLFTALSTVPSVTTATVRLSTSTMEIGYCESQTSEDAIRAALAPTGYVAAGTTAPSAPASTTP